MVYEFTEDQNKIVSSLAKNVRLSGISILLIVVLLAISFIFGSFNGTKILYVLDLLVIAIIAFLHFRTSSALKKIVDTEGNDIDHLMQALKSFSSFYGLYYWAFILFIVSFVLSYLAGLG